jgi:non-canonical purine NTP pyrophosphatase (RdgB/HAM1 family)
MKIFIATGNSSKYEAANKYLAEFGIKTEQAKLKLLELQGDEIETIALFKAEQAFSILNKPVAITDVGWKIPALNGFPGAYMHDIVDWFTVEDIIALMKNKKDRTILMSNVAVYKDNKQTKVFYRRLSGKLYDSPRGDGNIIDVLTTFRTDGLTIAECDTLRLPTTDSIEIEAESQWIKLGRWLKSELNT